MTMAMRGSIVTNILITLAARVVLLGLALASSVVLARLLGPEARGLFALVLLLPEWGRTLGLFGFEQAYAVYAGLEAERRRSLVWQSVVMAVGIGGAVTLAGVVAILLEAPAIGGVVRGPIWLYVLALATVPVRLLIEYWGALLRGMNRIVLLNALDVTLKIISLVLILVAIAWFELGVTGAVWADTLSVAASLTLLLIVLRSVGAWGPPSFDRSLWRRTASFAIPAHGGTIAAYVNYRVDEFIIAILLPPEDLAFYVIAVGLVERLWILPGAVSTALLPHLTNSPERDAALPAVIARHVMVWTGAACLVIYALAEVIVNLLYSSAYAASVAPLRWLLPGIFALSVGKVLVAELLARKKPRYTVWASGIAALVNIAANLLLVPRLGISGAAISSSISYALLSAIIVFYYLRETGLPWTSLVPGPADLRNYTRLWHGLPAASGM
jgi:O-antigen/teichoic acid export membrane protein